MSDDETTLTFVTEDLPEFIVGEPYEQWLVVDGATEPVTFEIESGEFPSGISLSSEGMVYGTPFTQDSGDTTVFITVSDATTATLTQAFDCQVKGLKGEGDDDGGAEGEDEGS